MSDCRRQDWAFYDRYNRIQRLQQPLFDARNQEAMEDADDNDIRDYSPLATLAAIVLVCISGFIAVHLVLTFADVIDNMGAEKISTAPSHTSIVLHERARGERWP